MVGFIWLETGRGRGAYLKGGSYSDAARCGVRACLMATESGFGAHCWLWPWLPGRGAGSERGRK